MVSRKRPSGGRPTPNNAEPSIEMDSGGDGMSSERQEQMKIAAARWAEGCPPDGVTRGQTYILRTGRPLARPSRWFRLRCWLADRVDPR